MSGEEAIVKTPNRLILALGLVAVAGSLGARSADLPRQQEASLLIQSVMRVDTLQLADSVQGPTASAGGGWLVLQVAATSPSIDSEMIGEVTLTGGGLRRPHEARGFTHASSVRTRTVFYRVIPDRGGGFFTPAGHVHWIVSRTGRARIEVYGRATFGVAFDGVPSDGPFQLHLGGLTAEVRLPAMLGAR
jgi:hypothetical protein